jgi:galactonate dehydratase
MIDQIDVFTVKVSDKTTWIWIRLAGNCDLEGVGEATLNNRTNEVLAALPVALAAAAATDLGLAAKLTAIRTAIPGPVGRAVSSALEQAWLDYEGRRIARPIHALLGGRYRTAVPCYANINRGTLSRSPDEFAARAVTAIEEGYNAVKLAPFDHVTPAAAASASERSKLIEAGMARVSAVVTALSGKARIQVDCHSRFRPAEAQAILDRLARMGVSWCEEPVLEDLSALPLLAALRTNAQGLGVLLAGAEQAAGLGDFEPFCHARCYDIIMPDIILAGGPSEVMRIGHLAAAMDQAISLHNPCGPVMDMHSAHVAAALPELHSLERQFHESELYDGLVTRSHDFVAGSYQLSDADGLGMTIDWKSPFLTHTFSDTLRF